MAPGADAAGVGAAGVAPGDVLAPAGGAALGVGAGLAAGTCARKVLAP
jgi:hypothetical protein